MRRLFLVLLIFAGVTGSATAAVLMSISCKPEHNQIIFDVTDAMIEAMPAWSSSSGKPPPLAAEKAVAIAVAELPNYILDLEKFQVTEVALVRCAATSDKWVYRVRFQTPGAPADKSGRPPSADLIVLMSGTPVKGKIVVP